MLKSCIKCKRTTQLVNALQKALLSGGCQHMNLACENVVELVDSGRKRGGVSAFLAASAPGLRL